MRIKATIWLSDRVDLKIVASGIIFVPLPHFGVSPLIANCLDHLGVIDINAETEQQLQHIQENVCAAK